MLWRQGVQTIALSNHKLKSALNCTVWSQCTLVPDGHTHRRTDRRTNILTVARRFVQTFTSIVQEFCHLLAQFLCKFFFLCKQNLHKNCASFFSCKSCRFLLFYFILFYFILAQNHWQKRAQELCKSCRFLLFYFILL